MSEDRLRLEGIAGFPEGTRSPNSETSARDYLTTRLSQHGLDIEEVVESGEDPRYLVAFIDSLNNEGELPFEVIEKSMLHAALIVERGVVARAAKRVDMTRERLRYRLERLGLKE